jgi:hypothetical protein
VGEEGPISSSVGSEHVVSLEDSPPTRDFGSRGMVIVTPPVPSAKPPPSTDLGSTAPLPLVRRPTLGYGEKGDVGSPEGRAPIPIDVVVDSGSGVPSTPVSAGLPSHTVRMPSAPPHPTQQMRESQYAQLALEQEAPPPMSAAPPPYPSNFPDLPAPPPVVTVTPARAPSVPAPSGDSKRPKAMELVGGPAPSGTGGRWALVFITLVALVLGFLTARYVVHRRRARDAVHVVTTG